jgi:hypothetical protein
MGGVNFVSKPSWRTPDPNKWDDDNGHGTHVAGIIAAENNNTGVVGVAPEADLYALKVLDRTGSGYVSDVIAAIQWATDPNGDGDNSDKMDIINMSLGGNNNEWLFAACLLAYELDGLILVAAAGNGGSVIYPAAYYSVIAVSAIDSDDNLASFSSTGSEVELAAPGVYIYSTYKGGGYATISGTSMASPHVAGTAALVIWSGVTDIDGKCGLANEVKACLFDTAQDIGLSPEEQGYGLVDAAKAAGVDTPLPGAIAGKVTDADSIAIEGATVVVEGTSLSATADANGYYEITNVSVGIYTVTASADGYENDSQENVTVNTDAITSNVDFTLNPLPETGTMYVKSITFSSKVAGPNKFLYTTVKVVDGGGIALEGVRVEMTLTHDLSSPWNFAGDTVSNGIVKFTLNKAPSGYYTAAVTNLILTEDYGWDTTKGVIEASCELKDNGTVVLPDS